MADSTRRWWFLAPACLGLALALVLAGHAARTDSVTVDEPSHLVAGYTTLTQGDFRLSPDHPPLARALLALPLLFRDVTWRPLSGADPLTDAAWRSGDFFTLGRVFMESWNDGQDLVRSSRAVAIVLLLTLLVTVGAVAFRRFGPGGAVVAVWVAALDPTLLAHGHLATIDVPFSLVALLVLAATDRWVARPTRGRLALLAVTFAAASLVKFSWFTVAPAVVVMVIVGNRHEGVRATMRSLASVGLAIALTTLGAIWAAYGFRFHAARGADADLATMHVLGDVGRPRPTTPATAWEAILHDPATGADRPGVAVPVLRFAHNWKVLPEAYLYGVAYVAKKGLNRAGYLRGRHSMTGFSSYFPWAFAVKTPLPTLVLIAWGLAAGLWGLRVRPLSPFAAGGAVFLVAYLAVLTGSALNLGVRHLLPVTLLLAIAAGGVWPQRRAEITHQARRWLVLRTALIVALLGWLAAGTLRAAPHFLGYFNEAVGGWRNGHHHLADSNLDWGQDLLRLEAYLRRNPVSPLWLAQAGTPPLPPGLAELEPRRLFGVGSQTPHPDPIAGGLYVLSATELVGVYRPLARQDAWRDPRWIAQFEQLASARGTARQQNPTTAADIDAYEAMRRLRLVARLAHRPPDERIGTSLFLFRLDNTDVAEATTL